MQALSLALVAIIFYLGAASWQALTLFRRVPRRPALVRSIGLLALICHALVIAILLNQANGLWLGLSPSLITISALIAAVLLAMSLAKPVLNAAIGLFPLAAASLLLGFELPYDHQENAMAPGIALHAISSALAFAMLAIAVVQAILLAIQNHALRNHRIRGIIQALPPLTTMERVMFELIWAGMALLTLSIVSGFLFLDNLFAQHLVHKTVLSLAAWIILAGLLIGHHVLGWRGLKAVRWTLVGYLLLLLAYFGSKFVLEILLNRS